MNSSTILDPLAAQRSDRALFAPFFGLLRGILSAARNALRGKVASRRERRLRLCETVSLGERRMVALIQFEGRPLLVGVTPNSITLLAPPALCVPAAPPASGVTEAVTSGAPL